MQLYRDPAKPLNINEILGIMRETSMEFDSIHGLFGPNLDPSSTNERIRHESLNVYERECDLVTAIGGLGIVVHPSWKSSDERPATGGCLEDRTDALVESMQWLADRAGRFGVVYLIENQSLLTPF